jgi:uncharacterized membrane protein YkoI
MMMKFLALPMCALALFGAAPAGVAHASGDLSAASGWQAEISAREARNTAERAYPRASVLDVRFVDGGQPFYAVRMIEDGRRFDVRVDARTGRIL